jgi:hypothetical protein
VALPLTFLLWLILHQGPLFHPRLVLGQQDKELLFLPVPIGLCLVGLIAFGLILGGKVLCLTHSTQSRGAKELMLACLTFLLAGVLLFAAAHFFGGIRTYRALDQGLDALHPSLLLNAGAICQLAGVALIFLESLLFCQFQRTTAYHLEARGAARKTECYFLFICLLIGGSVGLSAAPNLAIRKEMLLGLAGAWLSGLLAQLVLLVSTGRCIDKALGDSPQDEDPGGQRKPRTRSGLHRAYQTLFPSG